VCTNQTSLRDILDRICAKERGVNSEVLKQVILLALEIAREGREGRKIGTLFVLSDSDAVLAHSRALILDPLAGHADEAKRIDDPNMRETAKELAQLDGAFIVSNDGIVLSACRHIDASNEGVDVPLGLGSRHIAAASITKRTDALAIVVSESSIVRVFDDGVIVAEILPELWLLRRYEPQLVAPYSGPSKKEMLVASKGDG
jgi:diadenylate cyclase